jgi:hypothetical protein
MSSAVETAEPHELESSIREVQVFRSGAVVVREATLGADALSADLLSFPGLPLAIDDDGVRVTVVQSAPGKATAQPGDVRAEVVLPALGALPTPPSQVELRDASERTDELERRLARIDTESAWVDGLGLGLPQGKKEEAPPAAPVAAWTGLIAWVADARARRADERRAIEDQLRAARREVERLQRREVEARARRDARADAVSKRVVLRLRGARPEAGLVLRLEYRVPGARWVPTYVLRVARDGASAELGLRAHVVQQSGEPWDRVRLLLSTADLRRETALPELRSLRIGRRQPPPPSKGWREPPTGSDALFEGLERARRAPVNAPVVLAIPDDGLASDELLDLNAADPFADGFVGGSPFGPPGADPFGAAAPESAEDGGSGEYFAAQEMPKGGAPPGAYRGNPPSPSKPMAMPISAPAPVMAPMADMAPSAKSMPAPGAARMSRSGAAGGGAPPQNRPPRPGSPGAPPPPPADDAFVVEDGLMRYADLAMRGWDAPAGQRGKLLPTSWREQLAGLDEGQKGTIGRALAAAIARAREASQVALPGGTTLVESSSGAFDHRYDADGLVDVPSDGQLHNVALRAMRAPTRTTLVVVPREGDQAVRVATLTNPLEAPLLAGPAEVYLEDEFLVTAPLRTVPAGGELTVGLGVEPALKVARNTFFDEESAGLLGGSLLLKHRVEIKLASRLATKVEVEVRERVPLAATDEKGVELLDEQATPPWEKHGLQSDGTDAKGGRRWRLTLEPGGEKTLTARWTAKIDGKAELVGGNRRD